MGYNDVLRYFEKQLEMIEREQCFLKQQRAIAKDTKNVALDIGISIRSVSNSIKRLLAEDKIKVIKGLETERYAHLKKRYVLNKEYDKEEERWKPIQ